MTYNRGMKLREGHAALLENRSIHNRMLRSPKLNKTPILKPASNNSKLSKKKNVILKGKWKGMPMFSLTLQERATCPDSCIRYQECYGNNCCFAHRFEHGQDLEDRLEIEVAKLAKKYPEGFVVRLHILGDFYSVKYVKLWAKLLMTYSSLRIFGYTAREKVIWEAIFKVMSQFSDRFVIRLSRNGVYDPSNPLVRYAGNLGDCEGIMCPVQSGKADSCLSCGFCFNSKLTVIFEEH